MLGIELAGVGVTAAGGFDTGTWQSAGIGYAVELSSGAPAGQQPPAEDQQQPGGLGGVDAVAGGRAGQPRG